MHRIQQWARSSARSPKKPTIGEPLALATIIRTDGGEDSAGGHQEDSNGPVWKRTYETSKHVLLSSKVNFFLVFFIVGLACNYAKVDPTVIFVMNAIAIIPLAGLLSLATESVAYRLGDTLGALLNVTFGNIVELIIFIALTKKQTRIVQASILGSILANLLLILGMSFLVGGLNYREQVYNSTVTHILACLLCLAVLSLLIPTAFHASFRDPKQAEEEVLLISRGIAVILLLVYILYLLFQLKSHAYMYDSTPQHIIDEESHPGILRRMNPSSSITAGCSFPLRRVTPRKIKTKLGRKRRTKMEPNVDNADHLRPHNPQTQNDGLVLTQTSNDVRPPADSEAATSSPSRPFGPHRLASLRIRPPPVFRKSTEPIPGDTLAIHVSPPDSRRSSQSRHSATTREQPIPPPAAECEEAPLSKTASIVLLLGSTALVALCAEFMLSSIDDVVEKTPLSEVFVGLIILPIVGNAAEHVTAVKVASKNKMDLAIGVAIGSSIQIALFITPLVVIIGWIMQKDLPLFFTLFETMTLFVATFVVNFLVLDGRSNWLEGALLCACYIIIGVAAFFFPDARDQTKDDGPPEATATATAMAVVSGVML